MDQSYNSGVDYNYESQQQDIDMEVQPGEEIDADTPKKKLRPWEKIGADGRPIKRKPNPAKKNAVFRRALQPKSSIMCLNELQSGLKYVTEPVATIGNFCVSVEVNEQTFRGYGSSKDLAKQAAAEAALVSFVKPPPPKPAPGDRPNPEDDTTPWRTLASFAMYKLFSDWRDGKIGVCNAAGKQGFVPNVAGGGAGNATQGFSMSTQQQQQQQQPNGESSANYNNVNAHLTRTAIIKPKPPHDTKQENGDDTPPATRGDPKPVREKKVNSESQRTLHPSMVLHQLVPIIKYESDVCQLPDSSTKVYTVTADIEDQRFMGQGSSIKAGKLSLAKAALKTLYNIDNIYVAVGKNA